MLTPDENEAAGRAFRHRFEGPFWRRVMLAGVRAQPQPMQRALMPMWAGIFYVLVPRARRIVERNLAQICGPAGPVEEKRRSFRLFVNYAQSIANAYALKLGQELPVIPRGVGHEHLEPLARSGRGAIMITGHMGFWQIAPYLLAREGFPPVTQAMAEEPNRALAEYEEPLRAQQKIVYTTSSPFASIELAAILRRGEFVGMQMDRHTGGAYTMLPFCGREAPFPLGPATLARATGAPLVPFFVVAERDRLHCTVNVEAPIHVARTRDRGRDARQAMAAAVAVYERYVRAHPEQWFNFNDFWAQPR
jgi:lauroyl/myristoyl acyltransferase